MRSSACSMVDGVVLVDASEGPLPQTRFVLRSAGSLTSRSSCALTRWTGLTLGSRSPTRSTSCSWTCRGFRRRASPRPRAGVPHRLCLGEGRPGLLERPTDGGCPTALTSSRSSRRSWRRCPHPSTTTRHRCRRTSPTSTRQTSSAAWRCCGSTTARCARASRSPGVAATAASSGSRSPSC